MLRFHARTDVGLKRSQNEDALLAQGEHGLFVVADGVGGRKAGELASALTVDTFQAFAPRLREAVERLAAGSDPGSRNDVLALLDQAANTASARVYDTAETTGRQGMTSTLAAVVVGGGVAFVVHVGDSRVYLLRDGQLQQLTEDHSLVNEMVQAGSISAEEAERSRYRNVITRAIGLYPNVQADTLAVELLPGDRLLLCSDGLSDLVTGGSLVQLMRLADVTTAVEALVDTALEHGGKDNITAIVVAPEALLDSDAVAARARVLERLFLFADLPMQARMRVGRVVSDRAVGAGEVVVRQGDVGDQLFAVVSGRFDVHVDGQKVAELGEGEHFGELALVDEAPRSATIVARTDGRLLLIERDTLRSWCAMEPAAGARVLWRLAYALGLKLRHANTQLAARA
jgi:serine/threonine protein phosphatase PrpC